MVPKEGYRTLFLLVFDVFFFVACSAPRYPSTLATNAQSFAHQTYSKVFWYRDFSAFVQNQRFVPACASILSFVPVFLFALETALFMLALNLPIAIFELSDLQQSPPSLR